MMKKLYYKVNIILLIVKFDILILKERFYFKNKVVIGFFVIYLDLIISL